MPLVKANQAMPERPVVIVIYGDPGASKTTLGNTAQDVIVLDFDRGVSRSFYRRDTIIIDKWEDVIEEETKGTFKGYKTVVIDTAKAALDDFLMSYVTRIDHKLKTNKLRAYGEIGDQFKLFLNNRRAEGMDVIIIAHAKKDEDTKRAIPDVTGQSYQLLLRIADQVGYVTFINNNRNISWSPTDLTVGKNTANLPQIDIPSKEDPSLKTFMANVIADVKKSISQMSEEQLEAMKIMDAYQDRLAKTETPEDMTALLAEVNAQEPHIKAPMVKLIVAKAKDLGFVANKETKRYELPQKENAPAQTPAAQQQTTEQPEDKSVKPQEEGEAPEAASEEEMETRCQMLRDMKVVMGSDGFTFGSRTITYEELNYMSTEDFNKLIPEILAAAKKPSNRNVRRPAEASGN
ncbi:MULTISPECIES: ATP-binding protein [unclassified Paraflavitalea]|uniref:ATP-binding protein n=1 Tax=unclassified Paraflavitalea TaxID=2798305 RepID=UPI003D34EF69